MFLIFKAFKKLFEVSFVTFFDVLYCLCLKIMSNNTSLLVNMSREEIEIELESIKGANMLQSKRIEEYEQQIYDLKRHLAISKSMEEHFSSEIESLQNIHEVQIEELMKKITLHEEQITILHQKHTETIQYYETELIKKDDEIIENINEIKKSSHDISLTDERERCSDEIYQLKTKINDLTEELIEFEIKYKDVILNNTTLEKKNIELVKELTELKEHLHVKDIQLKENKDLISNLQDEISVLQREMNNLKTLPANKAFKGNSLFAEVDDNRVKLQKNIQILKKQFNEMQIKYSNKSQELQKLHLEYDALLKEIENQNNSNDDQSELIKSYKRHFDNLNNTVQNLVRDLEEQKLAYDKLISGDMKFAIEMITANRSEALTLQQKLNSESLALAFSEQSHFETKKTLKHCQTEVIRLRAKILNLTQNPVENTEKSEIETKISNSNKWLTSSNTMLSHIDESLLFSDDDDDGPIFMISDENSCANKENLPQLKDSNTECADIKEGLSELNINNTAETIKQVKKKKVVSFTANTLEPKLTNRPGRKVINVLPTHIPNIKKHDE